MQHAVVEDDVRRDAVGAGTLEPPCPKLLAGGRPGSRIGLAPRTRLAGDHAELLDEAAPFAAPRHPEQALGARQPDVEQPPLLRDLLLRARLLRRQLPFLQTGDEDRFELEPF